MTIQWGLALAIALFVGTPVAAQQAGGAGEQTGQWTLVERDGVTAAIAQFDVGLGLIVRCRNNRLETLIAGLPPAQGRTRDLRIAVGDEAESAESWFLADQQDAAFSQYPARFARGLREGGNLNLVAPGAAAGGRNLRYRLALPMDPAPVEAVLVACDRPVEDPSDALVDPRADGQLPTQWRWARQPRPNYPEPALQYAWGFASLTCVSQPDGSLEGCQIEAQNPLDGPFGAAALRSIDGARLELADQPGAPVRRRVVAFAVKFEMNDPTAIPEMRPRSRRSPR